MKAYQKCLVSKKFDTLLFGLIYKDGALFQETEGETSVFIFSYKDQSNPRTWWFFFLPLLMEFDEMAEVTVTK